MASLYRSIDYEAVERLCVRLGVECETSPKDTGERALTLFWLGKNIDKLEFLAQSGGVTLYELDQNNLLTPTLARVVRLYSPASKESCDEANEYFHKEIGALIDEDRARFSALAHVGKQATKTLEILIKLHRDTCGFMTLVEANVTAGEQIALIGRIVESVCTDPKARRKLLAMFPPPTP